MNVVKGLFGSFESELYPKHEEYQTQSLAPIVNTPAGYPVVALKPPLTSPKGQNYCLL